MKEIGPETSGRPISRPLTMFPQRRQASVTDTISSGVRNSLKARISIGNESRKHQGKGEKTMILDWT